MVNIEYKNNYKYTDKIGKEACRNIIKRDTLFIISFIIGFVIILLPQIVFLKDEHFLLIRLLIISIFYGVFLYLIYNKVIFERIKMFYKNFSNISIIINDKEIIVESGNNIKKVNIKSINSIIKTKNLIILSEKGSVNNIIIKKDSFEIGTLEDFTKFLK